MIRLSHSARRTLHGCPRKLALQRMIKKPWIPSHGATIGQGFHKHEELVYTQRLDMVVFEFNRWSQGVCSDLRNSDFETLENVRKWHRKGRILAQEYNRRAAGADLKPRIREVIASESRFLLPMKFPTTTQEIVVPGVVDQLVVMEDDTLAIVDFKTTSINVEAYVTSLFKSKQGQTYLLWGRSKEFKKAFPKIYSDYGPPNRVIFDVVPTPQIRQKSTESFTEYLNRFAACEWKPTRHELVPSDRSMIDTVKGFELDARQLNDYIETEYFPMRDACVGVDKKLCSHCEECDQMTEGTLEPPTRELFQISLHKEEDGSSN